MSRLLQRTILQIWNLGFFFFVLQFALQMLGGPQSPWIVVVRDVVFILHMAKLTGTAERIFAFRES